MSSIVITLVASPKLGLTAEEMVLDLEHNVEEIVNLAVNVRNKFAATPKPQRQVIINTHRATSHQLGAIDLMVLVASKVDGQIAGDYRFERQRQINRALEQLYPDKRINTILKLEDVKLSKHTARDSGPGGHDDDLDLWMSLLLRELQTERLKRQVKESSEAFASAS